MDTTTAIDAEVKAGMRAAWALGDYHRFAKATIWSMGPVLVDACGIGPGQRVLDVAAGTGNAAIRAAEAGAEVVASDLTPENFDDGRREAAEHGVSLEWVEGDAEALPFPDASFDVVTSSFGAIFAPHHQAVADELVRVCRPGGTIGLLAFTPDGLFSDFFAACATNLPPPPEGASPPPLWGDEEHVRRLFGDRVRGVRFTTGSTSRPRRPRGRTSTSSATPSARSPPRTRHWPTTRSGRRRSTVTSWSSRPVATPGLRAAPRRTPTATASSSPSERPEPVSWRRPGGGPCRARGSSYR